MTRTVKLSHIDEPLEALSYPVSRESATTELDDVTLEYADGETNLGGLVADVPSEAFDSAAELRDELFGYLPEEALGEPGQSEGDA
jgi:hypothetical protein